MIGRGEAGPLEIAGGSAQVQAKAVLPRQNFVANENHPLVPDSSIHGAKYKETHGHWRG